MLSVQLITIRIDCFTLDQLRLPVSGFVGLAKKEEDQHNGHLLLADGSHFVLADGKFYTTKTK